jgi:DNA (cytosine-5)-methyltransferase 3A
MNVLSLFDGVSCGRQALERAGIQVTNYYASEIDKYAIKVTMSNYPNTIQLGSVVDVDGYSLPKIDLLIGGSPCQSFSFAGTRKGMSTKDEQEILTLDHYLQLKSEGYEFEGQSYLFWEYMRLLNEVKPKYFMLENVEMGEKWEKVLSKAIGVNGIHINSALVSAQNRKRIYWTNIGMKPAGLFGDLESIIEQPKDKGILLKDILEKEVDEKYFLSEKSIAYINRNQRNLAFQMNEDDDKSGCITSVFQKQIPYNQIVVHNTQRRDPNRPSIQKNKNAGGSGHLSRNDGKTYSLDTGNTNAVEVRKVIQLSDNNKSNGGTQPFQQDRIYDINGISPALQAQLPNGSTMINTSRILRLTPIECERLQTVADNYTNHVSDSQRYKMLGNGWTVDVIAHIFSYINK